MHVLNASESSPLFSRVSISLMRFRRADMAMVGGGVLLPSVM